MRTFLFVLLVSLGSMGYAQTINAKFKPLSFDELLIQAKANINISNNNGQTPLEYAQKAHNKRAIDILKNAGASDQKQTKQTRTPMDYVIKKQNEKLKTVLKERHLQQFKKSR